MATTRLSDTLSSMIDKLSNTDPAWVIFINDHIDSIKANAFTVTITDAIRDRYRYKFEHFLRDVNCPQNIMWIASIINEVTMYEDFVVKETILIPDGAFISNLYRKHRTSINLSS